jgi:hypothetical protein
MVPGVAIVGLLIFIYFNRYVQRKRDERRNAWRERKEEQLERTLQHVRDKDNREQNDEVSDTTEAK